MAGYCLDGTDGTDGLDRTLVGRTDVITRQDRSSTMGAVTGVPLLDLEGCHCAGWLLPTWDGWDKWTGWDVGGTGVRRTDVSTRRNGSATMVTGTGSPPLDLEGRHAMRSGSWHQLCQCCKDTEYLCRRSKIIQIECTQIRTSNIVQDSIKSMYDIIILWLHTTINCTYNVIAPRKNRRKMPIQILKIPSVTKRNRWANCSNLRISANIYRPKMLGKSIPSK